MLLKATNPAMRCTAANCTKQGLIAGEGGHENISTWRKNIGETFLNWDSFLKMFTHCCAAALVAC